MMSVFPENKNFPEDKKQESWENRKICKSLAESLKEILMGVESKTKEQKRNYIFSVNKYVP